MLTPSSVLSFAVPLIYCRIIPITTMATYREAWNLFQDEPNFPSKSNGMRVMTSDQNTTPTTLSKAELISELRHLRQDLQELQSAR
ncbi:hypothetical protein IFM60648_01663 [Aspergillus lentulus]|uniref:Uncharacterized protein n=1 Tax=Aspergillus lentulus TaxID=293939 RepID=A0ABQ0ZV05_ASPLE|nr:hypothetical protein IFM60648_01663 [Aspergillus lentulus]